MSRLLSLILIATSSMSLLTGCGTAPRGAAPIERAPAKQSTVKQVNRPVAQPVQKPKTTNRPYLTQAGATGAAYAPKGDQIVYATSGGGLFLALPNGQQARALTDGRAEDLDPAWSPDGSAIAFVRRAGGQGAALMKLTVATGQLEVMLQSKESLQSPAWMPNGQGVVFASEASGKATLYRLDGAGNSPVALWRGVEADSPSVTPDGRTVIFEMQTTEGARAIARVGATGGTAEVLRLAGVNPRQPNLSPSGRSMAYIADEGVFVANLDGSGAKRVATDEGVSAPRWNPAKAQLIVASAVAGRSDLQAIDLPAR